MTSALHIQLELAEMVDVEGLLGNGWLPLGEARPPAGVRLDEAHQHLKWQEPGPGMAPEELFNHVEHVAPPATDPTGMLDYFIRIRSADDVLRFARRYGPLRLCEHRMPSSHRRRYVSVEPLPQDAYCEPKGYPDNCSEPVDRWFFYVGQARALLEIGAALWQEKPGPKPAWKAVVAEYEREEQERFLEVMGETLIKDMWFLSFFVAVYWLEVGNVHLRWMWIPFRVKPVRGKPELSLGQGTFDLLAIQLVGALTRSHGIAICAGCSEPYVRTKRKPQAGRRNFCPTCGEKMASRLRQRDRRAKRKGKA